MEYYQIWVAVQPHQALARTGSPQANDEPVKRPCGPPYGTDSDAEERLGAVNVQNTTPTFFIDDPEVWALIKQAAADHRSVADVITAAVRAYVKPPGPVLGN